jgi:hypothetical protein
MKAKLYLYFCAVGTTLMLFGPVKSFSQCNCGPGEPADSIIYSASMPATSASSYTLYFPKFDPAIGTLSCVKVTAVLQGQSTGTGTITAEADLFEWLLSVTPKITAPTASVSRNFQATFGPDSLATTRWVDSVNHVIDSTNLANPLDPPIPPVVLPTSMTYGPEDLFLNAEFVANGPASAAYYTNLGVPVGVTYSVGGFFVPTSGGINYNSSISTSTSGDFKLYYYWCPNAVLAKSIKNFSTILNNDRISVQWQAPNQAAGTVYELQVSEDGKNFTTVYVQEAQTGIGGSDTYNYVYSFRKTASSTDLYFRIKETTIEGKSAYSAVNTVSLTPVSNRMDVYPNPATNIVSLQFEKELNGEFRVDIVNLSGQRVFTRDLTLSKTRSAQLLLANPPTQGMYYVRATDKRTGAVYINKLIMKSM